ncbi:MAG: glycosyltransferase family 9 protein [Candidatus Coatesbacteria bacterium]|nr:glycosyltransferase family 9 protein [Candidatus Coatesbacteria bacterium]
MNTLWIPKVDCKYYRGEKPCIFGKICPDCNKYIPWQQRILIIKLGAMGDVLRTTPILKGINSRYPEAQITWLTHSISKPLLENNAFINRLWCIDELFKPELLSTRFDLLFCFDKSSEAISLSRYISAERKFGFTSTECGDLTISNEASRRSWLLGLDDNYKFHENKSTYPEMIFEISEIPYNNEEYILDFTEDELLNSSERWKDISERIELKGMKSNDVLGINIGAGGAFANKSLPTDTLAELIKKLHGKGYPLVLLGGPQEITVQSRLQEIIDFPLVFNNFHNSVRQFAALLRFCKLILTGDTLAMHLAIAIQKPVIAFFTSTCSQEIELYGRGLKIKTKAKCAPCYLRNCPSNNICLEDLTSELIFEKITEYLEK